MTSPIPGCLQVSVAPHKQVATYIAAGNKPFDFFPFVNKSIPTKKIHIETLKSDGCQSSWVTFHREVAICR